ncbi:carbohydrate kinase family protein [Methylacidiphilum caldifontis]|uniref:Carbohydrate kinase n=1 Tax=Methylacidiphilum caldifontis TaxID=2795386 RepID=A0A4Y8PBC5_9BACT|nr:PfkB family carbohydrate kinase [Methylacidiphilum caldifontis]TFE68007.1 carbohydrate kinase [Methylacidiphilum caldifontis]
MKSVDVLAVGHSCYDLSFFVEKDPLGDEKGSATDLVLCGGGPAANAAVAASRLGGKSAFCGYAGLDLFGEMICQEFKEERVDTTLLIRKGFPTPVACCLVKPDGKRAVVNYRKQTPFLNPEEIDLSALSPKVILFDGHEPLVSQQFSIVAKERKIPTVLDGGSLHEGTLSLASQVDYLVSSEKFIKQLTALNDPQLAFEKASEKYPNLIVTLGEKGLFWSYLNKKGMMKSLPITPVDTNGAGDVFHGAFCLGIARGMDWNNLLLFATVAAGLSCTRKGARSSFPTKKEVERELKKTKLEDLLCFPFYEHMGK